MITAEDIHLAYALPRSAGGTEVVWFAVRGVTAVLHEHGRRIREREEMRQLVDEIYEAGIYPGLSRKDLAQAVEAGWRLRRPVGFVALCAHGNPSRACWSC